MTRLLLIELNEINFEAICHYVDAGKLPTFEKLLRNYGYQETTSESKYEEIEPWIQWVTAHTGQMLEEHRVFRLGDIVQHNIPQIWEMLENKGFKVGALCPMNANNRLSNPAFFIPDPWTQTSTKAPWLARKLFGAAAQAVKDNAKAHINLSSFLWLALGALRYGRPINYGSFLKFFRQRHSRPWSKSLLLDQLLADLFTTLVRDSKADFASIFLNAGAHIQHHHLFDSPFYRQARFQQYGSNDPISQNIDPLLDVYTLYDSILSQIKERFPESRLIIATGLHQEPHQEETYYWRLKSHESYLAKIGIEFTSVKPLMSRDFQVCFSDSINARKAEGKLKSAKDIAGTDLFSVDNRGSDLFVTLTYPHKVPKDFEYLIGNEVQYNFEEDIAFVAVKNGEHNGIGYLIDTGTTRIQTKPAQIELRTLPNIIQLAMAPHG